MPVMAWSERVTEAVGYGRKKNINYRRRTGLANVTRAANFDAALRRNSDGKSLNIILQPFTTTLTVP
jgi:hypothetical protein